MTPDGNIGVKTLRILYMAKKPDIKYKVRGWDPVLWAVCVTGVSLDLLLYK